MSLIEDFVNELNQLGVIKIQLNRQIYKDTIGLLINKYKDKEFKMKDDSFLVGFDEGYKSVTGIPNPIIKPIKTNNLI